MLGEAVDLLEAIVHDTDPRRPAAARRDRRRHVRLDERPPTKGKGLDGVVRKADGYDNPATTLLEEGATR